MDERKVQRINALPRISRERELTEEEQQERQALRMEYATHVPAEHADGFRLQEGHLGGIHPLQRSSHAIYEVDA